MGVGLDLEGAVGDAVVVGEDLAGLIAHAVRVAGVDHFGLGSDWDGAVATVIDASQTVYLTQALLDQGFDETEIRKIMGGNVARVLMETLPTAGTR